MAASNKGTFLAPKAVDVHGPRINAIIFSVVGADATLGSELTSGAIQGPEWTFSATTYTSLLTDCKNLGNPGCVKLGKTLGYTFDGIVFNVVQPILGTLQFRRAIQELTNYGSMQTLALHGIGGSAAPYLTPCSVYPLTCVTPASAYPTLKYSLSGAAVLLSESGLYAKYGSTCGYPTASIAKLSTSKLKGLSWYTDSGCTAAFNPLFYYRNDDPLRTEVATLLAGPGGTASLVGLTFNLQGIPDASAGGDVYGPSFGEVISTGGYCGNVNTWNGTTVIPGSNECPPAKLATGASALAADNWGLYTFGWVASSGFTFQDGTLFNSQYMAYGGDFGNFMNTSMDVEQNCVLYATTIQASEACAQKEALLEAQQLPVVQSFYENYLYANYVIGWTGYAAEPTTGPNTVGGAYYNFLNVEQLNSAGKIQLGGTYNYALHAQADQAGLNPLYGVNWVWQADVWSEIYDTPLATPPTMFTTPGAYFNWQVTSIKTEMLNGPHTIGDATPGWFNMQSKDVTAPASLTNGEVVIFTFAKNLTFSDNIPVTAYDYNESLYVTDVSYPPSLPDVCTPFCGADSGPFGLLGTQINASDPYTIAMYLGDQSVWNVLDVSVPMMPLHVMKYLNIDTAFTYRENIDMSLPYGAATGAVPGSAKGTAPLYILDLPNVEVGTGPFWLQYYNNEGTSAAVGQLDRNVNYFKSAWYDNLTNSMVALKGGSITLNSYPQEFIYNSAGTAFTPAIATGSDGTVKMTGANLLVSNGGVNGTATCSVSLQAYTGKIPSMNVFLGKPTGSPIAGTCTWNPTTGTFSTTISPSSLGLAKGIYEVTFTGNYWFLGAYRTWYQFVGIDVH